MALYSQIVFITLLFVNNVVCEVPLVYKPHRKVYRKGLFTAVHKNYINRYSLLEKFAHLKNSSEIINISPQCRTDLDLVVINLETEDWARSSKCQYFQFYTKSIFFKKLLDRYV